MQNMELHKDIDHVVRKKKLNINIVCLYYY